MEPEFRATVPQFRAPAPQRYSLKTMHLCWKRSNPALRAHPPEFPRRSNAHLEPEIDPIRRHLGTTRRPLIGLGCPCWPIPPASCHQRPAAARSPPMPPAKTSALVDTRVIYCGDNLDQLQKLPAQCVDLNYIDPPFNSNRNYEVFWGETKEKRAFEDRHESTKAYIDYMRPRCVELARVLKKTGFFHYHCGWHALASRLSD
jgi:DNA methylase